MSGLSRALAACMLLALTAALPAQAQEVFAKLAVRPGQGDAPLTVYFAFRALWNFNLAPDARMTLEFGDGTSETHTSTVPRFIPHTYREPGAYQATLTVEDVLGRRATDSLRVTVRVPQSVIVGRAIAAQPGELVHATRERNRASLPVVDYFAGEGLPLPEHLQAEVDFSRARDRVTRKFDLELARALQDPNLLLPDPNAFLLAVLGDEEADVRLHELVKEKLRQASSLLIDGTAQRVYQLARQGMHEEARALTARLRREAEAKYAGLFDAADMQQRLEQNERLFDFQQANKRLTEIRRELEAGVDDNTYVKLDEERARLVADLSWMGEDQANWARARGAAGDSLDATGGRFVESTVWESAADSSDPRQRFEFLEKAQAANDEVLRQAWDPERRALADLRKVQLLAKLGTRSYSKEAEAAERRHSGDLESAAKLFADVKRSLTGPGRDMYDSYTRRQDEAIRKQTEAEAALSTALEEGSLTPAQYDAALARSRAEFKVSMTQLQSVVKSEMAALGPDQIKVFNALISTGSVIEDQLRSTQEKNLELIGRSMGISYREVRQSIRDPGKARLIPRFESRMLELQDDWARSVAVQRARDDCQKTPAKCKDLLDELGKSRLFQDGREAFFSAARKDIEACQRGSSSACAGFEARVEQTLDNVDLKFYSLYYDYQRVAGEGGRFDMNVNSPFSGRQIVVRRSAAQPNKSVNVAFEEITRYRHYREVGGIPLSPEDVIHLSATTISVLAAGVGGGFAGGLAGRAVLQGLTRAAAREGVKTVVAFGARAVTEGVVFTAAERYGTSWAIDRGLEAYGVDVRISAPRKDTVAEELGEFFSASAANTAMLAFFHGAGNIGAYSGARAGFATAARTGSTRLAALAESGTRLTYELGGVAAWAGLHEGASAVAGSRDFEWDNVRRSTLDGAVMLPGLKLGGRLMTIGRKPAAAERETQERRNGLVTEFNRSVHAISTEAARSEPDGIRLSQLRRHLNRVTDELVTLEKPIAEHPEGGQPAYAASGRISAVEGARAAARGISIGAEFGARVRGNIVEVPAGRVASVATHFARNGASVTRTREGSLVTDPASGEAFLVREFSDLSPAERTRGQRRDRAYRELQRFTEERMREMPPEEKAWQLEKLTRPFGRLGDPRVHSNPEAAARGALVRRAFESTMRGAGVDLVEAPGLARNTGANARIAFKGGRWQISYDPVEATYMDLKEEASHYYRDVMTGRFQPRGGITRTDAGLAEVREAARRVRWLRNLGSEGPALDVALNRLEAESAVLAEMDAAGLGHETITSLASPHVSALIEIRMRDAVNQAIKVQEGLEQVNQLLASARSDPSRFKRVRDAELYSKLKIVYEGLLENINERCGTLRRLQLRALEDPASTDQVVEQLRRLQPLPPVRFETIRADIDPAATVRGLRFADPAAAEFAERFLRAQGQAEKELYREMGEASVVSAPNLKLGQPAITPEQIADPRRLVERLKARDTAPAFYRYLWAQLSPETQALLRAYKPAAGAAPPPELVNRLAADMSALVEGTSKAGERGGTIYHAARFRDVAVSDGWRELIERDRGVVNRRRDLAPDEFKRFNELVLRTALSDVVQQGQRFTADSPRAGPALRQLLGRPEYKDAVAEQLFYGLYPEAGVPDFVFAIRKDGKLIDVVVFEAKGGDWTPARLGTRVVPRFSEFFETGAGIFDAQQGTAEHMYSTLRNLQYLAERFELPEVARDATTVIDAVLDGHFRFVISHASGPREVRLLEVRDLARWPDTFRNLDNQAARIDEYVSTPRPPGG